MRLRRSGSAPRPAPPFAPSEGSSAIPALRVGRRPRSPLHRKRRPSPRGTPPPGCIPGNRGASTRRKRGPSGDLTPETRKGIGINDAPM